MGFGYPALETDPQLRAAGAGHTVEHPFFFPWSGTYMPNRGERKLQDAMILYWSRMARTSDPNGPGTPTWPRYEDGRDLYLELATPPGAKADLHKAQCDFWDTIVFPWPHL